MLVIPSKEDMALCCILHCVKIASFLYIGWICVHFLRLLSLSKRHRCIELWEAEISKVVIIIANIVIYRQFTDKAYRQSILQTMYRQSIQTKHFIPQNNYVTRH